MTNRSRPYAVLLLALQFMHSRSNAATPMETRAASVLFKMDETVVFTQSRFLSGLHTDRIDDVDSLYDLGLPFVELIGGLRALGPTAEADLAKSYSTILVGAKDFGAEDTNRSKEGLGMFGSHACYIAVTNQAAQPKIDSIFQNASRRIITGGRRVWIWESSSPEMISPDRFYAAQVAGSYLVIANNLGDFEEASRALTVAAHAEPALAAAAEWQILSSHNYWAYRLIRRGETASPAMTETKELTADTIALAFFADLDKREAFFQIISSDKSMKAPLDTLPAFKIHPLQAKEPGVWQALSLSKSEANDLFFQIFFLLGYGVIL